MFRDKIESSLRGQGILSIQREEMYQSNKARIKKENPSLLPGHGQQPRGWRSSAFDPNSFTNKPLILAIPFPSHRNS
jgi:hypothetical protein